MKISKNRKNLVKDFDFGKVYEPKDAIKILKDKSYVKFDETIDISINLGIDANKTEQNIKGIVNLPKGTGKKIKVAVVCNQDKENEAKESGADLFGSNNLIDQISSGKIDFDLLIATPDMMPKVAKLGRVLGPRGLMPNPKAGTVTNDIANAIKEFKAGKLEFRADKAGIVHVRFGKASFSTNQLFENLKTLQEAIDKNKPSGAKGKYWKTLYLSSTMGPSIQIDIGALQDYQQES